MDILKLITQKKAVIGTKRVLKGLAKHQIKEVLLSKNVAERTRVRIQHYATLDKVKVTNLPENSEELGMLCKKPFTISVIGVI